MTRKRRKRYHPRGTQPGTLAAHAEAGDAPVRITSFRYDANGCEERTVSPSEVPSLSPPEGGVLWVDVCGLSDPPWSGRSATASGSTPWRSRTC